MNGERALGTTSYDTTYEGLSCPSCSGDDGSSGDDSSYASSASDATDASSYASTSTEGSELGESESSMSYDAEYCARAKALMHGTVMRACAECGEAATQCCPADARMYCSQVCFDAYWALAGPKPPKLGKGGGGSKGGSKLGKKGGGKKKGGSKKKGSGSKGKKKDGKGKGKDDGSRSSRSSRSGKGSKKKGKGSKKDKKGDDSRSSRSGKDKKSRRDKKNKKKKDKKKDSDGGAQSTDDRRDRDDEERRRQQQQQGGGGAGGYPGNVGGGGTAPPTVVVVNTTPVQPVQRHHPSGGGGVSRYHPHRASGRQYARPYGGRAGSPHWWSPRHFGYGHGLWWTWRYPWFAAAFPLVRWYPTGGWVPQYTVVNQTVIEQYDAGQPIDPRYYQQSPEFTQARLPALPSFAERGIHLDGIKFDKGQLTQEEQAQVNVVSQRISQELDVLRAQYRQLAATGYYPVPDMDAARFAWVKTV